MKINQLEKHIGTSYWTSWFLQTYWCSPTWLVLPAVLCGMSDGVLQNILPNPITTSDTHSLVTLTTMGRAKNGDADENEMLSNAWIATIEDPVTGTNLIRKLFTESFRRRFLKMAPTPSPEAEGRYGARTEACLNQHFTKISADVQKFRTAIIKVLASNPAGGKRTFIRWQLQFISVRRLQCSMNKRTSIVREIRATPKRCIFYTNVLSGPTR